MRCHTTWERTQGDKENYLFMKIFKVLKNFYGFPEPAEGSRGSQVQGALRSHRRNVNNGMREERGGRRSRPGDNTALATWPGGRSLAALLHATTPSLRHPLNYRLTWTSWAMRLIIKWTPGPDIGANNIGVWQIHNNNKLQRAAQRSLP